MDLHLEEKAVVVYVVGLMIFEASVEINLHQQLEPN
jgi:hypothetical protein